MRSKGDKFLYQKGSDQAGEAFVKLLTTLKRIQQGKDKDMFGWCEKVEEAKGWEDNVSKKVNGGPEVEGSVDKLL